MTTTPNPTPPTDVPILPSNPPPPPTYDPMDTNHDGVVDADESFVSDGTGMHPTRTTFATTTVASSVEFGEETAKPTLESYHRIELAFDVRAYNVVVGESLVFSDATETWSNYNQHQAEYDQTTWDTGKPKLHPWIEGFRPRYSWDYLSPLTANDYVNLCPTLIYHDGLRSQYYFFREVYDDFQAYHGFANWSVNKDGFPGPDWPGMVKVVRSIAGLSQRPKRRSEYEEWFDSTYGNGVSYAAPYMQLLSRMPLVVPPTRYRYADPSREPRDEPVAVEGQLMQYKLAESLAELPAFQTGQSTVGATGPKAFAVDKTTAPPRSTVWFPAVTGVWLADGVVGVGQGNSVLAAQQASNVYGVVSGDPASTSYGCDQYANLKNDVSSNKYYSGWVKPGTPTQLVGYVTGGKHLAVTGYGFTSSAPKATVAGSPGYTLTSANVVGDILAAMPNDVSCRMGFIYDASVGNFGYATWISQL